jgi:decaprenylphospho-beta-D-erythro-pentofuranosid-2-ulose 2-reductase
VSKGPALILGGRSDIGLATAHALAARGHPIQLAARRAETLAADQADLQLRYDVAVTLHEFDALDTAGHRAFVAALPALPEIAVCAVGVLGRQQEQQADLALAVEVLRANFEGPAMIMAALGDAFAARGSGTLVGISSVAGERGRASNYVYGSAKAGFTAFLSGLRARLWRDGVTVITVLPGFVATKMVVGRHLSGPLTASPAEVADAIVKAIAARRPVVHVRWIWWPVMTIIRALPEALFKRLKV